MWVMRHLQSVCADSEWTGANPHRGTISLVTSLFVTIISQPYEDHFSAFGLLNILPVLRQGLHFKHT